MAILGIDFLRAFKLSVDPAAGRLVQGGTGLTLYNISLSSGPTASAIVSSADPGSLGQVATSAKYNTSAVPGPDGQAVSSSAAVPGRHGRVASSPSTGPGPDGQAVSSSSSSVTGCQPPGADGQSARPTFQNPLSGFSNLCRGLTNPRSVFSPPRHEAPSWPPSPRSLYFLFCLVSQSYMTSGSCY
jgi:hypothetical protein